MSNRIDYLDSEDRKDGENTTHKGMDFFIKIFLTCLIAFFINILFVSSYVGIYGMLFGEILCVLIYVPLIIIIMVIFLLIRRSSKAKFITNKATNIFCILLGVILVVMPMLLVWPSLSPTYNGNLRAYQLSFSTDNTRLLVNSEGSQIMSVGPHPGFLATYQVWDLNSGRILWNTTTNKTNVQMTLSPNGASIANTNNDSLFSLQSFTYLGSFSGNHFAWIGNGTSFITATNTQLYIWDTTSCTIKKTITYNNVSQIIPSDDGAKIAVIPEGKAIKTLSVIAITSANSIYLINLTVSEKLTSVVWSADGNELQITSWIPHVGIQGWPHQVSVWNLTTKTLIQNTSFVHYSGEHGNNALLEMWFGKYVVSDYELKQTIVYDITTGKKEHSYGYYSFNNLIEWSHDKTLMAYQNNANIEIQNTSTGNVIMRLPVPVYELKRLLPGFEIILVFCAIAALTSLHFRRERK
jgi:hypothetical protein